LDFEDIDRYLRPLKEYYRGRSQPVLNRQLFYDNSLSKYSSRDNQNKLGAYLSGWKGPPFTVNAFKYRQFHLRLCKSISGSTFITTKKGYMGITEGVVRVGDIITLISGLSKPVVLEHSYKGDAWELIGTCHVHGVMDGECWTSDAKLETFDLI
jgi:hypothetical protein